MREIGGVLYINDGDWVESCTALVEHADGRLELIDWPRRREDFISRAAANHATNVNPLVRELTRELN
jgi:hypothetical protein